jgi:hypothetical protein
VNSVKDKGISGRFVEIGCWEGKSASYIANAIYPEILICNDTWLGNVAESIATGIIHPSEMIVKSRDVYSCFINNMNALTKGNYSVVRRDCLEWLKDLNKTNQYIRFIKFIHIDASHEYESVANTIRLVLPYMVDGGIICGDDFYNANINRLDLNGGVERAVREYLPSFKNIGNLWYYVNEVKDELINPINISIPEEKIANCVPHKTKVLSDLIPGKKETYVYETEEEYYKEYKKSMFALTTKKAGWDCLRHYEILANGTIPYFPEIDSCPERTLTLLPKDLIMEGNKLYERIKTKNMNEIEYDIMEEYVRLASKCLAYTKDNLTTKEIAKYILEKTNHQNVKRILYLTNDIYPDYLRCLTLHGFKSLYGSQCHDYPKIPHIYKGDDYKNYYGKGFTYTNLLEHSTHNEMLEQTIEEDIRNRYYDIVIYGSYHRGMLYYDLISQYYKPNEIILLCGEDIHDCEYKKLTDKGHYVFVRELYTIGHFK